MGILRQEYWRGLLFLPPGDLPDPGMEPVSPAWQATTEPPGEDTTAHLWLELCGCSQMRGRLGSIIQMDPGKEELRLVTS